MGATLTGKTSPQARHGLIALIAIRQGQAVRARRAKEEAEREAKKTAKAEAKAEARSKKRGWFR
jgi:hypothetical protein